MKRTILIFLSLVTMLVLSACASPKLTPPTLDQSKTGAGQLIVLSDTSPHITTIDLATNTVKETKDMAEFTKWTWNDDNNYFDGTHLWLGMKYPEKDDAIVISLNLSTLEVSKRLPIGKEAKNLYIGKGTRKGILHVGKQASGQVVTIDTKKSQILETWDMPVNGGVVCDADIGIGSDGIERFYYPTRTGDTVVSANAITGQVIKIVNTPKGATPLMHTNAPDGRVWVQESGSNTNAVFEPVTLDLLKRFPSAKGPVVATFSPDGKHAYIGHFGAPVVQVVDTHDFREIAQVTVGNTPSKIAVHPNGKYIYAILSKESGIAVVDTSTWTVTERIPLGSNPNGMFLWSE